MLEGMLKTVVELANDFNAELEVTPASYRMVMVKRRIAENEVVFACWQDDTRPHNVGFKVIKGQQLMRRIMADHKPLSLRTAGIKCIDAEQAEALAQIAGERDRRA
jgi:hypothetical protein